MGLQGITLYEISQTEKDKCCVVSLSEECQKPKKKKKERERVHRYGEQIGGCQRWGVGQ